MDIETVLFKLDVGETGEKTFCLSPDTGLIDYENFTCL